METFQEHKRDMIAIIVFIIMISLAIGYAYLSSNLNINGSSIIDNPTWDVHWENVQIKEGSVEALVTPTIDSSKTTVTYEVQFDAPGQFYEFTVDAVNAGTIDAMIDTITSTLNGNPISSLPDCFIYSITYSNGSAIEEHQELYFGNLERFKVRIEYKKDIDVNDLPTSDQTLALSFGVTYVQMDDSAIRVPGPVSFATDSWPIIIDAVQTGKSYYYRLGETREIDLGEYGIHTLRVANMSTPSECSQEGFSQTACGFVIEFADIITKTEMKRNNYNTGGYVETAGRRFINNDIYELFPQELQDGIIDTYVVAGYGSNDHDFGKTNDKLYFLNFKEIYNGDSLNTNYRDNSTSLSRQLDNYQRIGVSTSNYQGAIKQYNGSNTTWWLRSSVSFTSCGYYQVSDSGSQNFFVGCGATANDGISPAFRIG